MTTKDSNKMQKEVNIVIEDGVLKHFDKNYEGEYVVPSSVIEIEAHAFKECQELTGIIIPASVLHIGKLAFNECCKLEHIHVDESNPTYDSRENCNAIIETSSNTLILGCVNTIIPDSVKRIGEFAFDSAYSLEKIFIPNSVKAIGDWAFANCYDLRFIRLSESLELIGMGAFWNCQSLQEISLPKSLVVLDDGAFLDCVNLRSVRLPASVKLVKGKERIFCGCCALKSISVDAGNEYYDSRGKCEALIETANNMLIAGCENTIIPNDVESIADGAFSSTGIVAAIIPESVTHIGKSIFESCEMLSHIVVNKNNPVYDSREDCNAVIRTATNTLICGCNNTVIPEGVSVIGESAFYGLHSLKRIKIPNSVHAIGEFAFGHCRMMTKLIVPDSVNFIAASAFWGCHELTLSIPANCEYRPDQYEKVKKVIRRKVKR